MALTLGIIAFVIVMITPALRNILFTMIGLLLGLGILGFVCVVFVITIMMLF